MRLLDIALASFSPRVAPAPVLIVNGHPDPRPERFCAALAQAYRDGIQASGGQADILTLGTLKDESVWADAADRLRDGAEFAAVFPLWLDKPPPLLAGFIAEAAPQFCSDVIVTMAMPAFAHRARPARPDFFAIDKVQRATFIGSVETISPAQRQNWLAKIERLGRSHA